MSELQTVFMQYRRAEQELRSFYDSPGVDLNALTAEQAQTEQRIGRQVEAFRSRLDQVASTGEAFDNHPLNGGNGASRSLVVAESRDLAGVAGLVAGRESSYDFEARALNKGSATEGAELVPTQTLDNIQTLMFEEDQAMSRFRLMTGPSGHDLVLPRVTANTTAALIAEGATIGESEQTFDTIDLTAYKFGYRTELTTEVDEDSEANVAAFLLEEGGRNLGRAMAAYAVAGTGTDQPNGVVNNPVGMTTAAVGAVTFDELVTAQHSILPAARQRASWVFNDATIASLRKVKDGDGNYLWQPPLAASTPETLLGRPVYTSPNVDILGADNVFGVYGDLNGHVVRQAGPVRIQRSESAAFDRDVIVFRFLVRMDSDTVDTTAIRTLKNAA